VTAFLGVPLRKQEHFPIVCRGLVTEIYIGLVLEDQAQQHIRWRGV
jgi:hypothetical protein